MSPEFDAPVDPVESAPEVLTVGETMVLFSALSAGRLRYVDSFRRSAGGAESNFAVALARLGIRVGWFSRLGDDEFGHYIESFLRGERVDISRVIFDKGRPTGVLFKEQESDFTGRVIYFRRASAASALTPEDVDEDYVRGASHIHLTGITLALSDSAGALVDRVIDVAKDANRTLSLDANIRKTLWTNFDWIASLSRRLPRVDLLFATRGEAFLLTQETSIENASRSLLDQGPSIVVIKEGAKGAYVSTREESFYVAGRPVSTVAQSHGAGDAFAAGFVAALRWGWHLRKAGDLGALVGAHAVVVPGNTESLPFREEALSLLNGNAAHATR